MSRQSKIVLTIVWTIVALILVGIMVWGIVLPRSMATSCSGMGWRIGWSFGGRLLSDSYEKGQETQVPASSVSSIRLHFVSENVVVETTNEDSIRIEQKSSEALPEDAIMRYGVKDGQLIAESGQYDNQNYWFNSYPQSTITLYVPADLGYPAVLDTDTGTLDVRGGTYGGLDLDTDTGAITASGITAANVTVDSDTGAIGLDGVKCADLTASTDTGRIDITGLDAARLFADSDIGDVYVAGAAGMVELDSDTGSVVADMAGMEQCVIDTSTGRVELTCADTANLRSIDIDTDTGSVTITLPENDGFTLDFDSDIGSLSNAFEMTNKTHKNGRIQINVDTSTGSLDMRKK